LYLKTLVHPGNIRNDPSGEISQAVPVECFSGRRGNPEGGLRLEEFTRHRATSAACRFGLFAKPYRNDRDLRIPAIKAAASSGHRRKRAIEF
jgi:hypothetical protein